MTLSTLPALHVQPQQVNTVANFQAAQANAQSIAAQKQQMASAALEAKRKGMEGLYIMSAGLLRDGEVSPQEWESALNMMEQGGTDAEFVRTLRGRPELARILAAGSSEALKVSQDERLLDFQIDKLAAEIEAAKAKAEAPLEVSPGATLVDPTTREPVYTAPKPVDTFGNEKDLFAQYSGSDPVKTYEIVKTSYERVRESAAQQSGAGDLGLIYGYMRMLDPGSVVRESEFAMAAQAGDYGEQIQGFVSRILNGQRLPESQRQEFVRSADALYQQTAANLAEINSQFSERAAAGGVDPTRFIREPEKYDAPQGGAGERTTPNGISYSIGG